MDRNGKKAKAPRDGSNPERGDTKSSARDVLGRAAAPPGAGRQGHRG